MRLLLVLLALPALAQEAFTGAPVERDLAPKEKHSYRYPVQPGLFLSVTAAQQSGNVGLILVLPDGKRMAEMNLLTHAGDEHAAWIASAAGDCVIEVLNTTVHPARYRLEAVTRTPTTQDRHWHAAYIASAEGKAALDGRKRDQLPVALARFETAAAEWQAGGEPVTAAGNLNLAGVTAYFLGQPAKALDLFQSSAGLVRNQPAGISVLTSALNNLGQASLRTGDLNRGRAALEESLALIEAGDDRSTEGAARNNLANIYRRLGLYDLALRSLELAAARHRADGGKTLEIRALQNMGILYNELRDYQKALDLFSTSLRMANEANDPGTQFGSLRSLGSTYAYIGEDTLALQFYERAEALARKQDAANDLGGVLAGMAQLRLRAKDYAGARKYLEETLKISRAIGDASGEANSLNGMCYTLADAGEFEKARPFAAEAIAMNRKTSPAFGLSKAEVCLARIETQAGNFDATRKLLEAGLAAAGDQPARVNYLDGLAELEERQDHLLASLANTEEAAALADQGRTGLGSPGLRAAANAGLSARTARHTHLLMRLHRTSPDLGFAERAWAVSERERARSLTELIAGYTRPAAPAMPKEYQQQETKLVAAITAVQRQLFREGVTPARQQALRRELAAAESDLAALQAPHFQVPANAMAEPFDLARIQSLLLDARTALIEFALGDKESYAWVITREGFRSFVLPGRAVIEERVEAFRGLLGKPVSGLTAARAAAAVSAAGGLLQTLLIGPLESALKGRTRLLIVPDGGLHYLPFEVLGGATPLVERFQIAYAPSASALAALRRRREGRTPPPRTLMALADPELPGGETPAAAERGFLFTRLPNARLEANVLRDLFGAAGSRVLLGADAREGNVKSGGADGYRYVHFATHGYLDEAQPARSGLVLAREAEGVEDGFLQAREIFRLKLNADVVTLSACQSGLGKLIAGEGVMGLSRAFLYAGAQSLVVSLWNVNDAATAELMKTFYGHLKAGVARDEALRRAKLALRNGPNRIWRHPYYWAPFVLIGDPLPGK